MTRSVHLFGNWKWTGPAELAVATASFLRPPGELLIGRCPFADLEHVVRTRAQALGLEPVVLQRLQKHWNPLRTSGAAAEVSRVIGAETPEILHVHLDADHAVAHMVAGRRSPQPLIVRSVHAHGPHRPRTQRLLRAHTDQLVTPTPGLARDLGQQLGLRPDDVALLEPSIDIDRFQFTADRRQRGRERFGLDPDEFVVGIVARIQTHRRYELLWEAWEKLARTGAPPKLVVMGRGTHQERLAFEPVKSKALQDHVLFPGYQSGEEYLESLAACDAGIFLVPGTDIACRAVREWMSMGRGVIASRRPPLPELVQDGVNGVLIEESADSLAEVLDEPDAIPHWRQRGLRALETARARFDPGKAALRLATLYECVSLSRQGAAASFRPRFLQVPASSLDAIAAVSPGHYDRAARFVAQRGVSHDRWLLFHPWKSRDAVLDLMHLIHATRARHLLLEAHPEWDRPLFEELASQGVEVALLDTDCGLEDSHRTWLRQLAPELCRH